jgi:hypothetical protein
MPVRPLVTSAPLLGRRRAQCSRARDLLGARHPLVHAVDNMRAMVEQSIVVATMLTTSVSAVLAGVSEARAAVAAARPRASVVRDPARHRLRALPHCPRSPA